MKITDLREGAVYASKSGIRRRLLEIGEPGKPARSGPTWTWHGVLYECLDGGGGHRVGDTPTCEVKAFARWAHKCISAS